jgi:hypothetical protein
MANMPIDFWEIMKKYCDKVATYKGRRYMGRLSPQDGIQLSYDLESIGIIFMGVEIWYSFGEWVAENYWDDFTVNPEIYNLPNASQISAELCRKYISNDIPKDTIYISFVLNIPMEWNINTCDDLTAKQK